MRVWPLLAMLMFAAIPLAGCVEDVATPEAALKRDKRPPPPPPPPPAPDPVDPTLPGFFLDGMASPVRAFGTPEGRLLVTDAKHKMVLRVDPVSLRPDQALRVGGKPLGVAHLGQRIYVGNADRATVEIYAAQGGDLIGDVGRGMVTYPSDIAVDPLRGLVFVVDGVERMVKVFDSAGLLVRYIAGPGTAADQLVTPIGIVVDTARQQILVSDYGAPPEVKASVKIFDYDGTYVDLISGAGKCGMLGCTGGFSRPQGLAITPGGQIYLADAMLSQVLVFDRATKALVRTIGGYPTLHVPAGVVITARGDLFVVSTATASVVAFLGGAQ